MEAEYLAISYGITEFFINWNRELDARYEESEPSRVTKRPLPPPIEIRCDNEVAVKQLSRQYHIGNDRLRKVAKQIWQATQNIDVKFTWIPRKQNQAGMMLR